MKNDMTRELPTGQVEVSRHKDGDWFLIQIGRGRYTKRFNLSRSEIDQIIEAFSGGSAGTSAALPPAR